VDACREQLSTTTRLGSNVFFLVDASPSLVLQPVWDRLTLALAALVDDPAHEGLGVGVGYYGLSCDPALYEGPGGPVAPLPAPAQPIHSTFPLPLSGKAIVPALRGSYRYVESVLRADPLRDTVLVLVSDGVLDPLCGSTEAGAVTETRAAFAGAPRIETRVVALGAGPSLLDPGDLADLAPLDAIAAAGGTGRAERVQINLLPDDELRLALERAVAAAEPCAFRAPEAPGASARLRWRPGVGDVVEWTRVAGPDCLEGEGYFLRASDPTRIELCPESCSRVRGSSTGTATLVEGCAP